MFYKNKFFKAAVYAVLVVGIAGYSWLKFDQTETLIAFNNTVLGAIDEGDSQFTVIGPHMGNWNSNKEVNIGEMKKAVALFRDKQLLLIEKLGELDKPAGQTAENFFASAVKYLNKNIEIADDYAKLTDYIGLHNPGSEEQILLSEKITADNLAASKTMLAEFDKLHKAFSKEHNFGQE